MTPYKKASISCLAIFAMLLLTACGTGNGSTSSNGDGKRLVKIGYLPITHAVPLYIEKAMEDDYFETIELELVKFGAWPDLMDALNAGEIDGASVLINLAMRAKAQGIDLKAVALGHRDGNVIVTSPDIHSVDQLKGKNFAIPHQYSAHNLLLYLMLKQGGLDYEDVERVEMPPAEMPAALSEGRIAGYVVAEPFGALSVAMDKGKVLFQSEELWKDSVDCALVLRNEFIQDEREAAQEFVNGYVKAGEKAELKDDDTFAISQQYMDVDREVMELSFEWITYDQLRINEEAYEELRQYVIEMGLSENPPTFEQFVDNSLFDEAK